MKVSEPAVVSSRYSGRLLASALALACLTTLSLVADENWRQPAGIQWSIAGGDWHNSRYSTLNKINAQTVGQLAGAWTSQKFDAGASRATPVVKDGVMFVTAGASVYALNAKTGATLWQYGQRPPGGGRRGGAPAPPPGATSQPQGAPSKEGVALGEGLVFAGLADAQVIALNEQTGELGASTSAIRRRFAARRRSVRQPTPPGSSSSVSTPTAASAVRRSRSTPRPDVRSGSFMSSPVQESRVTKAGRRTTIRGRPAAAQSG